MREHVSTVFMNTDHFAEVCRRLVNSDEANLQNITGIAGDDTVATDDQKGRGYTHQRPFEFADAATLNPTDAVKVGDLVYQIDMISDPVHGMRTATLVRYEPEAKGGKYVRRGGL